MRLILMRHAERDKHSHLPECQQPLREPGPTRTEAVSRELASRIRGAPVAAILSSSWRPALETAEIVKRNVDAAKCVKCMKFLTPDSVAPVQEVREVLMTFETADIIVMVGHEPQLSRIAQELTGEQVSLKRSGCCLVEFSRELRLGSISWVLNPEESNNMKNVQNEIGFSIYSKEPELGWNVRDLDLGSFVQFLADEPGRLGNEEGEIRVQIHRSHEWEFLIDVFIQGTQIFAEVVIKKISERLVEWAAKQLKLLLGSDDNSKPEIRAKGSNTVQIISTEPVKEAVSSLMQAASKAGERVMIIIEPNKK